MFSGESVGVITVSVDDEVEERFRKLVAEKYGRIGDIGSCGN